MISDKLYALAFEYKKTKLWEMLWDEQLFAVKMPDERIGYISIMGAAGQHCALGLYIGEDGFESFREIAGANEFMMLPFELHEHLLQQNCLQCVFESKDELSVEEREEAKKYARAHGIKIAGKNAYPHFLKYKPNCYPWHLQTDEEQEELCEALAAAIEMARLLKEKMPGQLGLKRIDDETKEILMLERRDGAYILGKTKIPEDKPKKWPAPKAGNDIGIANLKKAKRVGVWECAIIRFPEPVQDDPEEIPVFPVVLLAVEDSMNYILPVSPVIHYEDNPEELLNLFMDAFLMQNICPMKIKAQDERTYEFVKPFCDRLKIAISIEEELPALEEAEYEFLERFDMSEDEEMADMLDELLEMDSEQLDMLPEGMVKQFGMLVEQGVLPDEMEQKLKQLFHFKDAGEPEPRKSKGKRKKVAVPEQSYVISVSIRTGCYRHIQISGRSTLLELHSAILEAFGFDDDHAHAFFMDNKVWSENDCYYVEGIESYYRTTKKYKLDQVGLYQGMQFKYLFDFGDEWTFQCKVLRILEGGTDEPSIVRSKGKAPEQYADWDGEWDD